MLFSMVVIGREGMSLDTAIPSSGVRDFNGVAGGAIMISDMFNNGLKARGRRVMQRIVGADPERPGLRRCGLVSVGKVRARGGIFSIDSSSLLEAEGPDQSNWWPTDRLAFQPASEHRTRVRYAYFPATRKPRYRHQREGDRLRYARTIRLPGSRSNSRGSGSLTFSRRSRRR